MSREDDPYNYANLSPYPAEQPEAYTFNVNFDTRRGKFQVSKPVKDSPESLPAPHPHLEGMDRGEWWCVVTVDRIFGPYLTLAAAQSVIVDGLAPGGQVHPMSHP